MNYQFHPPRHNRVVRATVNALLPALLAWRERIVRVQVAPEDRQRLELLRGRRALLLPNHPSESEPPVMTWLARELGEPFFFAATHEIFRGFNGWLVPRMGAFSILRGRPDFAAMRTARDVLVARNAKLVLFPEGETHMQNDLVLPLHRGAAQIGLWALRDLERAGHPPTLPAVPIAIRYRYVGDVRPVLLAGMARLERCLGLPPPTADAQNLPDRLRRTGLVVLAGVEREYGLTPRQGGTLDARIAAVTEHVAARVAHVLPVRSRIATNRELPVFLRMRALFNATFDYLDGLAEAQRHTNVVCTRADWPPPARASRICGACRTSWLWANTRSPRPCRMNVSARCCFGSKRRCTAARDSADARGNRARRRAAGISRPPARLSCLPQTNLAARYQ
jgi:1-acyl-sn-glycerol-3-phosphate acyltransferase